MKRVYFTLIIAALMLAVFLTSCSKTGEAPASDNVGIVGSLSTELPDAYEGNAHFTENMELFGDSLKNVYNYECVYRYFITGDKDSAYSDVVKLKTKLLYAIKHDYYLTEEEQDQIRENAENYLRMQYDTLSIGDESFEDEYSSDAASNAVFGITADQYTRIRLYESLAEKCASDMEDTYEKEGALREQNVREFYEARRDMYDHAVLRYVSFKPDDAESARQFFDGIETVEDMLEIIGGESDLQTVGDSNGQVTVYMKDTAGLFYEFVKSSGRKANAKTIVYDTENVYVVITEGYFTYDTGTAVAETVKEDYIKNAVESEMLEDLLEYKGSDDWYIDA